MQIDETWFGAWGWATLALVTAGLAEQKNRSRLVWFLLTLLLGPLATAWVVIGARAPDQEAVVAAGPGDDRPTSALLWCGVVVLALAVATGLVAAASGEVGVWVAAGAVALGGVVLVVLHVLAWRLWRRRGTRGGTGAAPR